MDDGLIRKAVRDFLTAIGEDPEREGLKETPDRVARACTELFAGYEQNAELSLERTFSIEAKQELVIIRDITFYSFCEHHMLPFSGKVHIGYIPGNGKVLGASKLIRVTEVFSRRLQLQERMTSQIAEAIYKATGELGVGVVAYGRHLCMTARGVKNPTSEMITSSMKGAFMQDDRLRQEFLRLVEPGGRNV